jgi:uncharacterized membrane protein YccC
VLRQATDILTRQREGLGYALTCGIGVTAADLLSHGLTMGNAYWVPMTFLLILRPDIRETATLVAMRLGGTVSGAGLLTLLMALLRSSPPCIIALIAMSAWSCFAFQRVNYALLSFGITAMLCCCLRWSDCRNRRLRCIALLARRWAASSP